MIRAVHFLILLMMMLPNIFSSALIAPDLFTYRVPLYIIGILVLVVVSPLTWHRFLLLPTTLIGLFTVGTFINLVLGHYSEVAVSLRQLIVFSSLFFCSYVGYMTVVFGKRWNVNVIQLALHIHLILFIYGIYTYIAQVYSLPEILYFLRPSPVLNESDVEYLNIYSGWAGSYRAYSIWFEPSFSSIVLAVTLPLLFINKNRRYVWFFLIVTCVYTYLTYSRAAWLIYILFFGIALSSRAIKRLFNNKMGIFTIIVITTVVGIALQAMIINMNPDISSVIRLKTVILGAIEAFENLITGTGSAELLIAGPYGNVHIHNAFVGMFHWLGLFGLIIMILPFINIAKHSLPEHSNLVVSFCILTASAFVFGGGLHSLSTFWYFLGFYSAITRQETRSVV